MRHYFPLTIKILLFAGCLAGISGCASMMDVMPTPSGILSGVDLKGPYDADIPPAKTNQIRTASLMADWAVPYIFLSVASRFESEGDEKRALAFYDRAFSEFGKRNNVYGAGTAWRLKMAALQRFGNDDDAFRFIKEMEVSASAKALAAFVSYSLGHYYAENGDYVKAIDHFRKVLDANEDYTQNPDMMALRRDTEMAYGKALIVADYFPAAAARLFGADFDETFYREIRRRVSLCLSHLEKVQSLNAELAQSAVNRYFPDIVPSYLESDIHNYLGLAFAIQGETDKAFDHLEKAGTIARNTGYHMGKADGVFFLNQVYLLNKNSTGGKQAAYSLQNVADQYQILPYAAWSRILLAHHERNAGNIDSALNFIQDFLDLMEKNAFWLPTFTDFRGTDHFKYSSIYDAVFDLYVQKGDRKKAFKTAESIKSIPLVAAFRAAEWGEKSAEEHIIRKLRNHRENTAGVYRRLLSLTNSTSLFLKTVHLAERLQKEALGILSDMKNQHEALYCLTVVDPPDAGDIQRQLDQNTTLFSYYSTGQNLYIWVISRNGTHMEKIKMPGADIEKLIFDYHMAVALKDRSQIDALAEKAYEAFLKPVIRYINGDRIILIPHGALYKFPFATMRYMNSYLVDVFSIFYLPHAGMIKQPKGGMPVAAEPKKSLIIARPGANRAEFEPLLHFYPRTDYAARPENPKESLMKISGSYEVIYFASECYLPDQAPLGAGFLLSSTAKQGAYLAISDLLKLSINSRVSVIASCLKESSVPAVINSRDVLISSLLYTSTPAVIMPLWSVDEKSRSVLMERFYKHLKSNEDIADAFKETQNDMIRSGAGPSEWGAYILYGRQ